MTGHSSLAIKRKLAFVDGEKQKKKKLNLIFKILEGDNIPSCNWQKFTSSEICMAMARNSGMY